MAARMNAPLYTTEILRLAASLPEPHELEREDGRAELRSPTCGSRIALAVQLDAKGRVEAVSQQVHACAFGQASAALLERGAIARSRDEVSRALRQVSDSRRGAEQAPGRPGLASLAPAPCRKSPQ